MKSAAPKKKAFSKFTQGLAQCLVEMQACRWSNQSIAQAIDIFGVVTNVRTWQFYNLALDNAVYETLPYSVSDLEAILGQLHYLFQQCEHNLHPNE